jgi:acyl carrier protein
MTQGISSGATTVDRLTVWLRDWMAREFGVDRSSIDPGESFLNYGLDSVQAMTLVGDIEAMLGLELPPTLAWDYPDIDALSAHLADRMTGGVPSAAPGASSATSPAEVGNLFGGFRPPANRDVEGSLEQQVDRAIASPGGAEASSDS